ncbi:RNA-binding protein squid [Exaiptasia diaphana]|uniref:RRM domain-containing protein n=1 Tax=Exaiptasia diaphana TaxID=2652724 RepID=A0A913XWP6_EXADI|nr:RNA-binding protein squid [Exaiptasia diaphana]
MEAAASSPSTTETRIYHPSRLFIGGLHKAISELELENFFAEYGSITDVRIVCDKRTGESKGFGFVTFETPETRDNLLKLDKSSFSMKGKDLRLHQAFRRKGHGQFASNAAAGNNGTPTTSGYPVQWVLVPTNNHHKEYYTVYYPQTTYTYGYPGYMAPLQQGGTTYYLTGSNSYMP